MRPTMVMFAATMLFVSLAAATEDTVSVAVFDGAAPVCFVDSAGDPAGFFPDILARMLSELGHKTEMVTGLSFREAFDTVLVGDIDILPAVLRTSEREKLLRFSDETFMISWGVVYVRPGDNIESLFDLRGARVAMMSADQNGKNFTALMASFEIPFVAVEFDDFGGVSRAVLDGSVDAGVAYSSYHFGDPRLVPTSIAFGPSEAFIATGLGADATVLAELDARLVELKADLDSYYYELLDEWGLRGTRFVTPRWILPAGIGVGIAALAGFALLVLMRLQERRIEKRLQQSELRFRALFDVQRDAIFVHELPEGEIGRFVEVNDEACRRLGYARSDLLAMTPLDIVDDATPEETREILETLRKSGNAVFPVVLRAKSGELLDTEINARLFRSVDRVLIISVARDIRARLGVERQLRESLDEKEVLIKEIHHRVKNNLQTISGLINTQLMISDDPRIKAELKETANRVYSMGLLHKLVYQTADFSVIPVGQYAESLSVHIAESLIEKHSRVDIVVKATPLEVDMDTAVPLGLFLNEAISNALKHGYREEDAGTVVIRVEGADGVLRRLEVADDGVGIPDTQMQSSTGLGIRMMRMLAQQLHGTFSIARENGTRVRMEIHAV